MSSPLLRVTTPLMLIHIASQLLSALSKPQLRRRRTSSLLRPGGVEVHAPRVYHGVRHVVEGPRGLHLGLELLRQREVLDGPLQVRVLAASAAARELFVDSGWI